MCHNYWGHLFKRLNLSFYLFSLLILCVCSVAFAGTPDIEEDATLQLRKGPYLIYTGKNTQMKVMWQIDTTDKCTISWGSSNKYSSGSSKTKEYGNDHQHAYTIKKLKPGKQYYYKVTALNSDYEGSFYTAPKKKAKKINFFVYGDTRTYPQIHNEIAGSIINATVQDPSFQTFALFVGDSVTFGAAEESWDTEFFGPVNTNIRKLMASLPLFFAWVTTKCFIPHTLTVIILLLFSKKYFAYPFEDEDHTYWSFDYGPAHVVIIDQYSDELGANQLAWIDKDLQTTDRPWKFVLLHDPGWSAGIANDKTRVNNRKVQTDIQPLLEKHQVTALFAGHNHYYARAQVNGVYHITTGGGGAPLHNPEPYSTNVITTSANYHYCSISADKNSLVFKAIKPDGTVIDTFTLKVSIE